MTVEFAINPKFERPSASLQQQRNMHENSAVWNTAWNFHLMAFELLPCRACPVLPSYSIIVCGLPSVFFQNNCWNLSVVWLNVLGCCQTTQIRFAFPLFHSTVGEWVLRLCLICWLHWSHARLGQLWKFGPRSLNESSISGAPTLQWSSAHFWRFSNAKNIRKFFVMMQLNPL